MAKNKARRYCACGTRLGRDHAGERCEQCARKAAALRAAPPSVPPGFWETEQFRDAFEAQHMGLVSRAYRRHPHHVALYGRNGIAQEIVGEWFGLTQAQVSRIETGPPVRHLDTLEHWVRVLDIPRSLLWFKASAIRTGTGSPREEGKHHARDPSQGGSPASGRAASWDVAVHWLSEDPRPSSASAGPLGGASPTPFPTMPFADADYLDAVREYIWHIVELDNRFGGTHLAEFVIGFFRSVHRHFGSGAYEPAIERDLQAVIGELAELAGWLLYDAARQDDVRRMNQEALYFSRLSGDRQMELLTLQNCSMHAGFLGRPREALHLAESVLQGPDRLTPRVEALFLMRKARALAQGGDEEAKRLFREVRSLFQDGVRDCDPKWAWWIDERELAWHEAMVLSDLDQPKAAVECFERSVAATNPAQVRAQYNNLAYLLAAQIRINAWDDAEETLRRLLPWANVIASQRTVVLLQWTVPRLRGARVPPRMREAAEQLELVLT